MKYLATLSEIKAFNEFLGGKWRLLLLDQLFVGAQRFGDLKDNIVGITPRMLTKELRELEKFGIVEKMIYREVPPKVEYSLTDKGVKLYPLLELIKKIGAEFLIDIEDNPQLLNKKILPKTKKYAPKTTNEEVLDIYTDDNGMKFVKLESPKQTEIPLMPKSMSTKKKIEELTIDEINIFEDEISSIENELTNFENENIISNTEIDFDFNVTKTDIPIKKEDKLTPEIKKDEKKPKKPTIIQLSLF